MKIVSLPSGAELKIDLAPHEDVLDLQEILGEEFKSIKIQGKDEIDYNLIKDAICTATNKRIRKAIEKCFAKCLYNGLRITAETWDPREARQDYWPACFEVAKENLEPFTSGLFAEFGPMWSNIIKDLASRPKTTDLSSSSAS